MGSGTSKLTGYAVHSKWWVYEAKIYGVHVKIDIYIRLGNYLFKKITHIHSTLMLY